MARASPLWGAPQITTTIPGATWSASAQLNRAMKRVDQVLTRHRPLSRFAKRRMMWFEGSSPRTAGYFVGAAVL
jgi:hypothetical protein